MSRSHARIVFREGSHYIEDLGATNGTHVNDVAVAAPVALASGCGSWLWPSSPGWARRTSSPTPGGEEFRILPPEAPLESARVIADRIRAITGQTPTRYDDQESRRNSSAGIAAFEAGPRHRRSS